MAIKLLFKSIIRQPLRSFILFLLIAVSTYTFTLRVVEFVTVQNSIRAIGQIYRTIGVLHNNTDGQIADVSAGAELVADSSFRIVEDRRRGFEGTLVDLNNRYVMGSHYHFINRYMNLHPSTPPDWRYFDMRTLNLTRDYHLQKLGPHDGFAGFVNTDAFFYGELLDIWRLEDMGHEYGGLFILWEHYEIEEMWAFAWYDFRSSLAPFYPHVNMLIRVDDVMAGYPEHVSAGVKLVLRYYFPEGEEFISPFDNLVIGERYFFRGTFYYQLMGIGSIASKFNADQNERHMLEAKPLNDQDLWYIHLEPGEIVSSSTPGLELLDEQLFLMRHAQSSVFLRTTRNMRNMPTTQMDENALSLVEGRWLDEEDYIYARKSAVIDVDFATRRGLEIGDTLLVHVNREQHIVLPRYQLVDDALWPGDNFAILRWPIDHRPFNDIGILSVPGVYPVYELELEIVGTFDLFSNSMNTLGRPITKVIYIPDSILPADMVLLSSPCGELPPDYLPALWYSFILENPNDINAFVVEYTPKFAALGLNLSFIGQNSENFWVAADMITISIMLNLIIFSLASLLVLVLTAFLFLRQRRRECAILRALGFSSKTVICAVLVCVGFLALPAIIIGATSAWHFSVDMAANTLDPLESILRATIGGTPFQQEQALARYFGVIFPSISLLIIIQAVVLVAFLAVLTIGMIKASKKSVLAVLQASRR